ncbi:Protein CBG13910, partial [Caenorhabditis briggsae]
KASARSIEKKPREAGLANVTTVSRSHILRQQITHFSRVFSIFPSICGDMNISNASDGRLKPIYSFFVTVIQFQTQFRCLNLTFLQRTLGGSSAPKSSSLHQEQQQYERDTRSMPASKFWPLAKSSYPILHEIARKVHAIQASEADVERSFSIIKNSYTPNRQSLDLKMLEKLMILKEKDRFDTGET